MKERLIPQKYELCKRFSTEDLAAVSAGLATKKDFHYIRNAKSLRLRKKYTDRLLRRPESYLQFVQKEARKRKSFDFLYEYNIYIVYKKNRFIGFSVNE